LLPVAHDQHAPVLDEKHCAFRTHCPKGHAYTPENTQWKFKPSKRQGTRYWKRRCRTCYNASNNRRRSRQRRHHLVAGA
jgi:hypothetical protein